jgi:hypothetical protein
MGVDQVPRRFQFAWFRDLRKSSHRLFANRAGGADLQSRAEIAVVFVLSEFGLVVPGLRQG